MPFAYRPVYIAAAALLACAVAGATWAQSRGGPPPGRAEMGARQHNDGRSLSDAIRRVQRTTGGQILGAERIPYDGRNINRVKYLDNDGRVRYMDDPVPERSMPRAPRSSAAAGEPPPPHGANP